MLLKAGLLSLALLLASRLMGLLRESAQAAAFGTTGLGDLAVLMLSLPDWVAGVLASGALAYVLVPAWAMQLPATVAASQRRVGRALLALGAALAAAGLGLLWVSAQTVLAWLAPGLPPALNDAAAQGLAWSAIALPAALIAALWATRLQHDGDVTGLYGANLVVNVVLVAAIVWAGLALGTGGAGVPRAVLALGLGLLAAMGLRLAWQAWRASRASQASMDVPAWARAAKGGPPADRPVAKPLSGALSGAASGPVLEPLPRPAPSIWAWAVLSAGLPLALPFAARSLASGQGEGALAAFNYGWKLVELPLMLAIQLVATLAFPRVAAALAQGLDRPEARAPLQAAFGLAFVLACAAAAGLILAADALARLLFGWGRMAPEGLAQVAAWGRIGAWGLVPQAVLAVGLTVLAAQRRLQSAALGYALALCALILVAQVAPREGGALMALLNAAFAAVAVAVLVAMGPAVRALLPWRAMGAALLALAGVALAATWWPPGGVGPDAGLGALLIALGTGALAAGAVIGCAWVAGGPWRETLRR
jgi:putative peptidoglycan lipid II flippase